MSILLLSIDFLLKKGERSMIRKMPKIKIFALTFSVLSVVIILSSFLKFYSVGAMHSITSLSCSPPLQVPEDGCVLSNKVNSKNTLIQGIILVDKETIIENGVVAWNEDGKIIFIGCSKDLEKHYQYKSIICGNTVISPGLINPHDHLKYNNEIPDASFWGDVRYDRRHEWINGLNGKPRIPYTRDDSPGKVSWTELRQLIAGTTSVAGGLVKEKGLLRNVDVSGSQEGLQGGVVKNAVFPLGDLPQSAGGDVRGYTDTCAYPNVADPNLFNENLIFLSHVGEGVDDFAYNEVLCLTGRGTNPHSLGVNFQSPKSSFIHAIATNLEDGKVFKKAGISVVWSPRSNFSLYGHTAPVVMYEKLGVNVALSTDWVPSGSINLQRELICADYFNKSHLGGYFSEAQLWSMVTENAAQALGFSDQIGKLAVGFNADILAIAANGETYGAVWKSEPKSVRLVIREGIPLYGDDKLIHSLDVDCDLMNVCGSKKRVCLKNEIGMSYLGLAKLNVDSYPVSFCGPPVNEPLCIPSRLNEYPIHPVNLDWDQDGVKNTQDNCPRIFNPPRPMDKGLQPGYFCKVD